MQVMLLLAPVITTACLCGHHLIFTFVFIFFRYSRLDYMYYMLLCISSNGKEWAATRWDWEA
jgi:hypothetical protein